MELNCFVVLCHVIADKYYWLYDFKKKKKKRVKGVAPYKNVHSGYTKCMRAATAQISDQGIRRPLA